MSAMQGLDIDIACNALARKPPPRSQWCAEALLLPCSAAVSDVLDVLLKLIVALVDVPPPPN